MKKRVSPFIVALPAITEYSDESSVEMAISGIVSESSQSMARPRGKKDKVKVKVKV